MHNFLAGLMGMFMGFSSLFHGGGGLPHTQANVQVNLSGTPGASPSGMMRRRGIMNFPKGERPFFGVVTNVSGANLTVQMQGRMMMRSRPGDTSNSTIDSSTSGKFKSITVKLDSGTVYIGGTQSDIKTNTKVAGVGKTSGDGSITAVSLQINPTFPSGGPMFRGRRFN